MATGPRAFYRLQKYGYTTTKIWLYDYKNMVNDYKNMVGYPQSRVIHSDYIKKICSLICRKEIPFLEIVWK